jgi:thiosulfate/3-mercaptopyruvate sulfurtransferase
MHKRILNKTVLMLLLPFMILAILFCTQYTFEPIVKTTPVNSCEGCHSNYAYLQEVFSPDTVAPAGGCGGEAPHYQPFDRVFLGGDGYEDYKKSGHYQLGCTGCHNGTDLTADKNLAHSGDFLAHPSMDAGDKCMTCHPDIVGHFETSIHQGTGQKRKVAIRSGLNGPEDFDQLPAHQIEGYSRNCAICHGSCGNCHVVRPSSGGGGLAKGHAFTKTPNMQTVCVTCHTSRGGHAYLGVASGTVPDLHLTLMDYTCLDCHNGAELHGDGNKVTQRYAYNKLPKCEDCHTGLASRNNYHSMHYNDFNCQVCHSQVYNNCGSCHIHGEGARIPSYMDFKIAVNPIPEVKEGFAFALVRRTLAAPDNWKEYGVETYANFNALPTYNYTTPHNLLRWTDRTKVNAGESCSSRCHIRNENGVLVNKNLFLFHDDLLDWETDATGWMTVDGKLPGSWTQE